MEFIANFVPSLNVVDMWIPVFAMPGFVCGAVFSVVLGVAARSRRFEQLSVRQFGAWGALGGLVVSALGMAAGLGGEALQPVEVAVIIGAPALFSAAMASGIMALARRGGGRTLDDAGAAELPDSEAS